MAPDASTEDTVFPYNAPPAESPFQGRDQRAQRSHRLPCLARPATPRYAWWQAAPVGLPRRAEGTVRAVGQARSLAGVLGNPYNSAKLFKVAVKGEGMGHA